jgi:3-hydroxyacyl-[acyl-carrier-protein] dehydratase
MRFLMVDRICELEHAISARGIKNISWDDGFLDAYVPGVPVFSPVLLAESVAQLISWTIIEAKDFTVKPVITVLDSFVCTGHPRPGDQLVLACTIESIRPDSALANGEIFLNGRSILRLNHAVCYLYPLHELDPPERVRMQFANLYYPGHPLPAAAPAAPVASDVQWSFVRRRRTLDRIMEAGDPGRLAGVKNVTATDECFNDHFPLKPIFPGVFIMEAQASLAAELALGQLAARGADGRYPVLCRAEKVKFRRFVQPGDQMKVVAAVKSFAGDTCSIHTQVTVDGKNAADAQLHFDLLNRETYINKYIFGP